MKRYFPTEESINRFIEGYLHELKKPYQTEKKNGMITVKWLDSRGKEREGYYRKKSDHPEHLWIFNAVKVECKKYINLYGLNNIETKDYKSQWKNYDLIRSIGSDEDFYHTDIKHAYWQTARREGYITEKTYNKVISVTDPAMKVIRNKALACMTSPTVQESKKGTEVIEKTEQRDKDLTILYKDIRIKTFRVMNEIIEHVGKENVYMYKIDGVIYKKHVRQQIEAYLNAKQYLYETEDGFYMGDNLYCIQSNKGDGSGKIRRF